MYIKGTGLRFGSVDRVSADRHGRHPQPVLPAESSRAMQNWTAGKQRPLAAWLQMAFRVCTSVCCGPAHQEEGKLKAERAYEPTAASPIPRVRGFVKLQPRRAFSAGKQAHS